MTPPLSLSIKARKPTYLAGEGVLVDIDHAVSSDLDMETVELNRDRTEVLITPAGAPERAETLTGLDHAALHKIPLLQRIGMPFKAPSHSAFESYLELALYRRPLAAGKYHVRLRYRYGDDPGAVVESNTVEIEILPAATLSATHRWLAGANPRDQLATMWVVEGEPGQPRWLHRTAARHDPSVTVLATDFGPGRPTTSAPVHAHLNDIAPVHFARYVVWLESTGVGFQKIHAYGAASGAAVVSTGLSPSPPPVLVDPPLHRRDDSLAVVVRGVDAQGRPALACIDQPAEGAARWASFLLPTVPITRAAVVWDANESGFAGRVVLATGPDAAKTSRLLVMDLAGSAPVELWSTQDEILDVIVDQGLAQGHVIALARGQDVFHSAAWALGSLGRVADVSFSFDAVGLGKTPPDPVDAVARSGEGALSLLFRSDDAWVVVHPAGRVSIPFETVPASAAPRLVATPRTGVFVLFPDPEVGLRSVQAGP